MRRQVVGVRRLARDVPLAPLATVGALVPVKPPLGGVADRLVALLAVAGVRQVADLAPALAPWPVGIRAA